MSDIKIKDEVLLEMVKRQIREEVRKEVREELQQQFEVKEKPWKQVKEHIENNLFNKNMKRWDSYKIQSAIYLIIRFSLNINNVSALREEQVDQAIVIADQIIEMVSFPENPL